MIGTNLPLKSASISIVNGKCIIGLLPIGKRHLGILLVNSVILEPLPAKMTACNSHFIFEELNLAKIREQQQNLRIQIDF